MAYNLIMDNGPSDQEGVLNWLKEQGFKVSDEVEVVKGFPGIQEEPSAWLRSVPVSSSTSTARSGS